MLKQGKLFLTLVLLFFFSVTSAQSKRELELKKERLQKEIAEANKQLTLLSKSKTASLAQLNALKKKISSRQALIGTINTEINQLGNEIQKTSGEISSLENQMERLKKNYAAMIRFAQLNSNPYERIMFVFASADFNQAVKRVKYLQQINQYRRLQAAQIDSSQNQLAQRKSELEIQKNEKTLLRNTELKQKRELDAEKKEQDKVIARLQDKESKLKKDLAEKQKAKQKLENAIAALIRKEIEAAKKKAAATGKKNVTSENVFTLTPEAQKLSNSFAGNKGALPWPVEKGIISSSFGKHAHPFLKGVVINNDGVDIQSGKGSQARAIFNGQVSGTIDLPGSGSAVIVRHGEYLTVYSNLEKIFVKKGDKISTKQSIGVIGLDSESGKGEINLQIWKGFSKMDPQPWLARR